MARLRQYWFPWFRRTQDFLSNPVEFCQLQIRVGGLAPWLEVNIGDGRTDHDYDKHVRRYAQLLCLLCGMHPGWWEWTAAWIQLAWETSAKFYTRDELPGIVYEYYEMATNPPPPAAPWRLVTCPSCGREKRTLTSTGKIRHHSITIDKNDPGYGVTCPSSGVTYVRFEPGLLTSTSH